MGELDLSPPQMMIRLLMGFISARAIYTAAKLGLIDQISNAGSTTDDLSARLGADRSGLDRLLRSLTGVGVLRGDRTGRYFLTEIGETLRADLPRSIRDYAIYVHEFLYGLFERLPNSVRDGKPVVEEALGARFSPIFSSIRIKRPFSMQAWQIAAASRRRQSWMLTVSVNANVSRIWGRQRCLLVGHCHIASWRLGRLVRPCASD